MKKLLLILALLSGFSFAQDVTIVDGNVQKRALSGTLDAEISGMLKQDGQPFWIAWSEPIVEGEHHVCCYDSFDGYDQARCSGGCRLERMNANFFIGDKMRSSQHLEPPNRIVVFVRVADGKIDEVRPLSNDCAATASGKTVYWIDAVPEAQSVKWLESQVDPNRRHHGALDAIAMHRSAAAEEVLERFANQSGDRARQKQAIFWLASSRGRRGYDVVRQIFRSIDERDVRKHAVFAMSQSAVPEATDELLNIAKTDVDSSIRSEALFWLAQKAGKKASAAISNAIDNDPDTDVKKRAVFALSQMGSEGVTKLIEVANANRNPAVRREAVFWLGQSQDPRALQFIEDVLKK